MVAEPAPQNRYLEEHIRHLLRSYRQLLGRELEIPRGLSGPEVARWLYLEAPFPLLSHDRGPDPHFTYANRSAQRLFEMDWETFLKTPSRLSAEPSQREERERLLGEVRRRGYIENYRGVRISRSGKRFWIEAVVWNLLDEEGRFLGQAALVRRFWPAERKDHWPGVTREQTRTRGG